MIRSKTTFILGPGAAAELHMPGPAETLERIAQALDFSRTTATQMTRDTAAILRHVPKLAERLKQRDEQLWPAAQRIHQAAKIGRTIEAVIEQNDDDPLVAAFGKLALAVFTLQSENRSSLRAAPQGNAALPLQTGDYWLIELGRLITSGTPRTQLNRALLDVSFVSFTYDRAVEHFMPYAVATAYGMTLQEAQRTVSANLGLFRPCGSVGRLPWEEGERPDVEWGNETPWNMAALANELRLPGEAEKDRAGLSRLRATVAASQRLVFLGFDFSPQSLDLLIDGSLSHNPELVFSTYGMSPANRDAAIRMLKCKTGVERDDKLIASDSRCLEQIRDAALLLES